MRHYISSGRYLLFTSTSPISGQPTGGVRQLFMRDLLTGAVQMVSTTTDGRPSAAAVDDDADAPPRIVQGAEGILNYNGSRSAPQ